MKNHYTPWTTVDDKYIVATRHIKARDVASALGRSKNAISLRRKYLIKIGLMEPIRKNFTKEEDFYITLSDEPLKVIAQKLGREWRTVWDRRQLLKKRRK